MTAITAAPAATPLARPRAPARPSRLAAWATLARRRISLSAHTPREILAPLATPLLFSPEATGTDETTSAPAVPGQDTSTARTAIIPAADPAAACASPLPGRPPAPRVSFAPPGGVRTCGNGTTR